MNRILLLALGLFIFGCDTSSGKRDTENNGTRTNTNESVQEGAGTEISPQLEGVEDSASRLKVDEIHSAEEAHDREK
jgi:hypothetical protein